MSGIVLAAAPTILFLVGNRARGLTGGLLAAAVTALVVFVVRLASRQSLKSAVVGVLVLAVCAAVAAVTGQARGFFLVPAIVPFAVIVVCLITILMRRPLTGIILNRVSGGPKQWWVHRGLLRVHTIATSVAVAVNVVNATLQVVFYRADDTVVLAAAHIATGPIFATIVAVTIVYVRRALALRT
jgi:Protein of unknown function (DUF3159)